MSEQDLDTTIKIGVDGTGVSTGITSIKRSLHELGGAVKKITDDTNAELGKIGKGDLKLGSGIEKATKAAIKETSELTRQLKTAESQAFTGFSNIGKSAEAAYIKLAGQGVPENYIAAYIKTLKEAQGVQHNMAVAAAKSAAEQSALVQKAIAEENHYADLKRQHAAYNKSLADQNIAQLKAQQAAQAAYRQEVMNSELNFTHTGRGKSTAFLADKGARSGFDPAFIANELAGYKKIEDASKAAFQAANPHIAELSKRAADAGTSVKGLSASMRNVPAQFTDIIVSLQGGQAPLTVLLQQGGQLKDMFGGIGNAGRALGGYVMGLINPFTLVAGAVAVLGLSYLKGAAEGEAYNKALITTGNAAGVTANQLGTMAQAVAQATGGTVGAAAAALATLAGSTGIASSQFEKIAAVAVQMEKTTGAAVAETVKQFAELGKDPVGASLKLTESTKYLTFEVYQQIKALTDQGKTLEAGAVAQKAYASVMEGRLPALVENLGLVEKAWRGITGAAKNAWDTMANVGRDSTLGDQITAIKEKLADKHTRSNLWDGGKALDKELETLRRMAASKNEMAAYDADRIKREEASIALAVIADKFAGKRVLMEREIAQAQAKFDGSKQTEVDAANHVKALDGIKKKYEEIAKAKAGPKGKEGDPFASDRAAMKEWASAMTQADAAYSKATAKADDLSESERSLRDYLAASATVIQEQLVPGTTALVSARFKAAIAAEKQTESEKAQAKAAAEAVTAHLALVKAQDSRTAGIEEQVRKQLESNDAIGLTAEALGVLESANIMTLAAELERKANMQDGIMWSADIAEGYRKEAAALRELADAKLIGGAKKFADQTAKEAETAWKKTADSIESSLTDALMRGFENGKGFIKNLRDTIVNMFKTMVLRPIISGVMQPVAQGITGAMGLSTGVNGLSAGINGVGAAYSMSGIGATGYALGSQYLAGTMSAANVGGTIAGNVYSVAGGDALSGLLATNSAYGTAVGAGVTAAAGEMTVGMLALAESNAALGVSLGLTTTEATLAATAAAEAGMATAAAGTGAASAGLSSIPVYGWIAAAVLAAISLFDGAGDREKRGTGMRGTFAGGGFGGSNYDLIETEGGAWHSDKFSKENTGMEAEVQRTLGKAFLGIKVEAANLAASLGLPVQTIAGYSKDIELAFTGDAAKDQAAIDKLFTDMSEDMAKSLIGSYRDVVSTVQEAIFESFDNGDGQQESVYAGTRDKDIVTSVYDKSEFARDGETAMQTLQRLGGSITAVNTTFDTLGHALLATSLAGASTASKLIDAFGGMEAFAQTTAGYYQNFYTEAERAARLTEVTSAAFASLGLVMPTLDEGARAAYRSLVETAAAQDMSVEANRNAYAGLLSLNGAMNQLSPAFGDAAQAAKSAADAVAAFAAAADSAMGGAQGDLQSAIAAQRAQDGAALQAVEQVADTLRDALISAGQSIADFVKSLRASIATTPMLAAQYNADLLAAQGGDAAASGRIPASGRAYLDAQISNAATSFEANRATARMAGELGALPAVKAFEDKLLEAVAGTTGAVVDLNGKLVIDLTVAARSEIVKLVSFISNTDALSPEILTLALKTTDTFTKTVGFVTGAALPDDLKALALASNSDLIKTVNFALGSSLADDVKTLALQASGSISRTIALAATNLIDPAQQQLALMTSGSITKTFVAAVGDGDPLAMAIALAQSGAINKLITVSGGDLNPDQAAVLSAIDVYNKTVNIDVVVSSGSLTAFQQLLLSTFGTVDISQIGNTNGAGGLNLSELVGQGALDRLGSIATYIQSLDWGASPGQDNANLWTVYDIAKKFGVTQVDIANAAGIYNPNLTYGNLVAGMDAAGIPRFAVGTNYVPRDMLAQIHEGEAIIPKAYNPAANTQARDEAVVAEIRALRAEIVSLRADNSAENRAIASNTGKTSTLLTRAMPDGDALATRVAT